MISKRTRALALSLLLVASTLAGTIAFAGGATAAPGGMVSLPDGQITQDVPDGKSIPLSAADLEGHVLVDGYADSTEVILTTPERADEIVGDDANVVGGDEMAIVLRDTVHESGRDVAIDAGLLKEALGHSPQIIYGTHSSGETWTAPAEYSDGYLRFHLDRFSSNVVTWSGLFTIEAQATDGSSFDYNQSSTDVIGNYTINVTGVTTTEWDNVSAATLSNGEKLPLEIGGNADPSGPSAGGEPVIEFTGTVTTGLSQTASGTGDESVSIAGDTAPSGPISGLPEITFTGRESVDTETTITGSSGETIDPDGNIAPVGPSSNGEPTLSFVGRETTQTSTRSATGLTNGDTLNLPIEGNLDPESGTVTITGGVFTGSTYTPSGNGDGSFTVLGDEDPIGPNNGEPSITFEGSTSTGTQTTTSGTDGDTLDPSGNIAPTGPSSSNEPEIAFVGRENTNDNSQTLDETGGSIDVNGNLDSTNGEVTIEGAESSTTKSDSGTAPVSGNSISVDVGGNVDPGTETMTVVEGSDSSTQQTEEAIPYGSRYSQSDTAEKTTKIVVEFDGSGNDISDWNVTVDGVQIDSGEASGDYGPTNTYYLGTDFDDYPSEVSVSWNIDYPDVKITTYSTTQDLSVDGTTVGDPADGSNVNVDLSTGSNSLSFNYTGVAPSYDLSWTERTRTEDPSVSVGSSTVSYSGMLAPGETHTESIGALTLGSHSVDASGTGPFGVDLSWTERTGTEDPRVDVTGDTSSDASASGVLASGETATVELAALGGDSQTVNTWTATDGPAPDWEVTYTPRTATENPSVDVDGDGSAEASHSGLLTSGESSTTQLAGLSTGSTSLDAMVDAGPAPSWSIEYDSRHHTEDPEIDIDGDGTMEVSEPGDLGPGESVEHSISPTLADESWTISTTAGPIDVDASITERTGTEDPAADIDGDGTNEASATGVLASGETTTVELAELTEKSQTIETAAQTVGPSPDWGITLSPRTATENPSVDVDGDGSADASASGILTSGENATAQLSNLEDGSVSIDAITDNGPVPEWEIAYDEELYSHDPAADVDGDGTNEASVSGVLEPGETVTKELPSLTTDDDTASISIPTGTVDTAVKLEERTQTTDPVVVVNGEPTSYSGTLADGETVSLETDPSWIEEGENHVDVTVTPSATGDWPAPSMQLDYRHDGYDDTLVSYDATKWTEQYNVSKTYAQDQGGASLSIPFEGAVVGIDNIEYRLGGSSWQDLPESDYSLTNTTLTATVGDVQAGETASVRATGSKVSVSNGEIQVTDPALLGDPLDTKVEISDAESEGIAISVGGTEDAPRVHYTYEEDWNATESARVTADGKQTIDLPKAFTGDTFRVATIPVTASPETGDVAISVPGRVKTSEPVIAVSPGSSDGEDVAFTFENALDDESYVLYSQTHEVVRDSGTASSPLTLEDDDSEEILQFQLDNGSTESSDAESSDDGGSLGPVGLGPTSSSSSPEFPVQTLLIVVGGLGLGIGVLYWRQGSDATDTIEQAGGTSATWIERAADWLRSHPFATALLAVATALGLIVSGLIYVPAETGVIVIVSLIPLASWVVLRRWGNQSLVIWGGVTAVALVLGLQLLGTDIFALMFDSQAGIIATIGVIGLAYYALKTYRAEASTPDTTVEFDLESDGGQQ